jgi:uroporphyrinogen decarboxylase
MTRRELLMSAVRNEETPRPAWVPFVGSHGAFLIDRTATEYLHSSDLIIEGLTKARELYDPDGLPITFDLQMEAENLGCGLMWSDDGPPTVTTHPLAEGKTLADLPEFDTKQGRFPLVMEALRGMREEVGDEIALYGLICGPFTLALHLLGNNIFLAMFDDVEGVQELVMYCAEVAKRAADAYIDNGADVIAVVDPMISQISPEHFEQFVTPAATAVFDHIRSRGALSSFFCCGDATRNIEVMAQTSCDNISVDENVDLAGLRDIAQAAGKSFGGNLQLTVVLLLGSEDDAKLHAIERIDVAGTRGYVMAPGCDLPFNTPAANVAAAGLMATDEYQRDIARSLVAQKPEDTFEDITVPDYANLGEVYVDLITLDSATCAPCQYMTAAAEKAAAEFGNRVILREHKITTRQGIGMLTKLGVRNLPTICLDGEPVFISLIPDHDTLVAAIAERVAAKS